MRHKPTDAEGLLWWELRRRSLGVRFRRQHPIGRYIVDFICLSHRIIVEADGSQHGGQYDQERDAFLRSRGYTMLRFWSWDVIRDFDGVVETIATEIDRRRVLPPTNQPPAD
jgi:very-short-patch-repair endonuclease